MERLLLKLFLYNLIFINATFINAQFSTGSTLPRYIIPEHYNLKLEPNFEVEKKNFKIFGRCEAYVKIILVSWCIAVHAQKPQIKIENFTVTNTESLKVYSPVIHPYKGNTHIVNFCFPELLQKGYYLLNISFIGRSDNDGNAFFKTYTRTRFNRKKRWFLATQLGAIGARQFFPCLDEPKFKATFNISVKHHTQYSVRSTMPILKEIVGENNMVWTHFKTTRLMPTYLISLLLYDTLNFPIIEYNILRQVLFRTDTHFVIDNLLFIKNVTKRFEIEWMAYSQNLSSTYHLITSAGPQHNSMGLILYRASNVLYDKKFDPVSKKIKTACFIAHEVARQWINNLITPSWFFHFWLNEGIARLLGMDIIHKIFQDSNSTSILDLFAVQSKLESLQLDYFEWGIMDPVIFKINKTKEVKSLFSFSYYIKGPVILRMLRQHLSDEVFLRGIEMFLNEHMFSLVTTDDFWRSMQAALNTTKLLDSNSTKIFNVKEMMNAWTNQRHYAVLKVKIMNCTPLRLTIENFYRLVGDDWLLPITIINIKRIQNIEISTTWRYYLSKKQLGNTSYIEFEPHCKKDELVIIDLQQGYYRVNYESEYWRIIARYLNSANYSGIEVLNRAQIIDDAFHFFSMQQLDMYSFLELIKFLSQETNYVVWYPMIKALESMSKFFPIYNPDEKPNSKNILKILNDVLERIGYEEHSEEDDLIKCLREEVVKWACTFKHPKCLQMAKYKLEQHLFHHKEILPWWKEWTYCKGLMTEKNLTGIWKTVLEEWMSDSDNRIWEFLTCIAHPNSIKEYLDDKNLEVAVSLKNVSLKVRNIDRVNRFLFTITKHAKNNEILDYILNNFDKLKPREVSTVAALIILINNVYSKVQLQKITAFVKYSLDKGSVAAQKILKGNLFFLDEFVKITAFVTKAVQNILKPNLFFLDMLDMIREKVTKLGNQQIEFINHKIQKRASEIHSFTMTNR
ncbi:glutamyl aminopeptidase-like [Nylanderia fulva]|uniref:glutamyl aminopeptidase-like n=1 Tax=Nylanderia fulva TaxID=613905 RepID=UPI0010FB34D8|nr:glutamyl aminopeptidase-like [Nylanderia fulva]